MADHLSKQLNSMTSGLDDLKKSLNEINKAIPDFTNGMQAGLSAIAKVLPDVVTSMMNLNNQNKELASQGGKPVSVLSQLTSGMLSWNTAISIGTTLLITYGGQLLSWVSDLLKGQTTLSSFTKALKDNQIVTNALIQSQLNGQKAAQAEVTNLTTLYNASQSLILSKKQNLEAANMLKKQWPESFKGMSDEAIVTGKATDAYKALKKELVAVAQAQEHKKNITNNSNRALDNDQKIVEETKKLAKLQVDKKEMDNLFNTYASTPFGEESALTTSQKIDDQIIKIKESQKVIADLKWDTVLLNRQNNLLDKDIDKKTKAFGSVILNGEQSLLNNKNKGSDPTNQNNSQLELQAQQESIQRMALLKLDGYAKEITAANQHFDKLKEQHKGNAKTLQKIEEERIATVQGITAKFQKEDLDKLASYQQQLNSISVEGAKTAKEQAFKQLDDKNTQKLKLVTDAETNAAKIVTDIEQYKLASGKNLSQQEIGDLNAKSAQAVQIEKDAADKKIAVQKKYNEDKAALQKTFDLKDKKDRLEGDIIKDQNDKNPEKEYQDNLALLKVEEEQDVTAARQRGDATYKIEQEYEQKKLQLKDQFNTKTQQLNKKKQDDEVTTQRRYVQALDSVAGAVTAIFGKNTVAARVAFKAHQAAAAAQVIIDTRTAIMGIWSADSGIPFVGVPKAIAETAIVAAVGASNLAAIIKQKPGFAQGGQFVSDGRGAILPGYSRADNTNAYLRSGEAVVVSEAMRNPWARNLVSAINVAHGGRDFAVPNPGRGYAIGGIFTDGGNANRYYNQPMNDQRDLANTLAYQMINNFPPIYVDVKDVNNQQNILAQTINRVNL